MNKEQIYLNFQKKAYSDEKYYNFGKCGIIEEVLAYFGLPSKEFKGTSAWVHEDNLQTLHNFIMNNATDEQLELIYKITEKTEKIPKINPILASSGKVFVSMTMNKEKYDCVDLVRKCTKTAIEETGNEAYYVDLDTHNGNISDKIIEEIKNCKFLVADFTYQNLGVYYEAGYAKGIGKTVIYSCRADEFEKIHFDIKQIQFVVWKDEKDFICKLIQQIEKSNLIN